VTTIHGIQSAHPTRATVRLDTMATRLPIAIKIATPIQPLVATVGSATNVRSPSRVRGKHQNTTYQARPRRHPIAAERLAILGHSIDSSRHPSGGSDASAVSPSLEVFM
jgi:hypothetical protein